MENTRKALAGNDIDAIKNAVALLSTSSHKLAEEMYKKTASQQGTAGGGADAGAESGAKKEEKVVEAEFEEVDKDKK